jgi:phage gpG-like protein
MVTLEQFLERLKNVTPEVVGQWIEEATIIAIPAAVAGAKRHFLEQQSPDGTPWPILAHDRPSGSGTPLRDTGMLMASLQGRADSGSIVIGTNRIGAAVHQYGAKIVPVNAKYLTIPTTAESRRAGSPRNYGDLVPRVNRARTRGVLLAPGSCGDSRWDRPGGWHVAFILTTGPLVIPARPFVGFSTDTQEEILDIATEHVVERLLEAL